MWINGYACPLLYTVMLGRILTADSIHSTVMLNTFVASSGCWQALATSSFVNPVWAIIPPFWIMNYTLCWNDERGVTLKIKGLSQKLPTGYCTVYSNQSASHRRLRTMIHLGGGGNFLEHGYIVYMFTCFKKIPPV